MPRNRGRWALLTMLCGIAVPAQAESLHDIARAYFHARAAGVASELSIPSYARQTGLACSACHYQFLALTPYGREFKLNGYTLTTRQLITERDSTNGGKLGLSPFSLLSAMATAGVTHVKDTPTDTQNDAAAMPQELSVFLGGQITPKVGLFSQFTYAGADGSFGMDNLDLRFATHTSGRIQAVYGLTLNNNPSVQDLWNTTPAWGYPFIGSDAAPGASASPVIDGAFAQNVLGIGAYTMVSGLVYGEVSVYRSAIQGQAVPDVSSGAIDGVAPYWRLALQKAWGKQYLMVGTYGMHARVFPAELSGPTNGFTDVGLDAQFETGVGHGNVVARGTWIHESQTLNAAFLAGDAENTDNHLTTVRFNTSYYPSQWVGVTGGFFSTTGSADAGLYQADPVDGSANGSPKTTGFTGELDVNPWENARIGLLFTGYGNFNGGKTDYDGFGRNASGNNTFFLFAWLAF